uniref:Uncharacterized protein n=1 Tax=Anguilla anguilla TaxID=7936 RepID=A0A0E9RZ85_ANGAN
MLHGLNNPTAPQLIHYVLVLKTLN